MRAKNMSLSTGIDDSLHCTFIYVVANELSKIKLSRASMLIYVCAQRYELQVSHFCVYLHTMHSSE